MPTFLLVQTEAMGSGAQMEVGNLETSQLHLPPFLGNLVYFYWSHAGRSITPCVWLLKRGVGTLGRWRASLSVWPRAVSCSHLLLARVPEGIRLMSKADLGEDSWLGEAPWLVRASRRSALTDICFVSRGAQPRGNHSLCTSLGAGPGLHWVMGQLRSRGEGLGQGHSAD